MREIKVSHVLPEEDRGLIRQIEHRLREDPQSDRDTDGDRKAERGEQARHCDGRSVLSGLGEVHEDNHPDVEEGGDRAGMAPTTTKGVAPPSTAASNTTNLPMNPLVNGIPAKDSRKCEDCRDEW